MSNFEHRVQEILHPLDDINMPFAILIVELKRLSARG